MVELTPGTPGRPQEYCSPECRRGVEYARRQWLRVRPARVEFYCIADAARLRAFVIFNYGREAWQRIAGPPLNVEAVEWLLETRIARTVANLTVTGLTAANLTAAGLQIWTRRSWADAGEADSYDQFSKLRRTHLRGGETLIGGAAILPTADGDQYMDKFETRLASEDGLAEMLAAWFNALDDNQLEVVRRDAAALASAQQGTDYGAVWQAIASSAEACQAARLDTVLAFLADSRQALDAAKTELAQAGLWTDADQSELDARVAAMLTGDQA